MDNNDNNTTYNVASLFTGILIGALGVILWDDRLRNKVKGESGKKITEIQADLGDKASRLKERARSEALKKLDEAKSIIEKDE